MNTSQRVEDQLEALFRLAKEATNGWACYARTTKEHDEIARLHREIDQLQPLLVLLVEQQRPKAKEQALLDAAGLCESEANKWRSTCPKTAEHWEKVATILRSNSLCLFVEQPRKDLECGEDHEIGSRPHDCFACLSERCDALLAALKLAQPEFCSMKCPSVFRGPGSPRHIRECLGMLALIREAESSTVEQPQKTEQEKP